MPPTADQPTSAPVAATPAPAPDLTPIGPTPIRFYSGNLSVGMFMKYWGKDFVSPLDVVSDELLAILKRTSCTAMCDYPSWVTAEPTEGKWDFSVYRANAEKLHANGLQYVPFCWVHFPPKWYEGSPRFVPYTDLVTSQTIPQLSLWSPDFERIYTEFYRQMAKAMGDQIDFLRLAMPAEYGEIGYCAGMTAWLRPQEHARAAYWCGDRYARADFRKQMLERYGSVKKINAAWATAFKSEDEIAMPDPVALNKAFDLSPAARRRWVDFIDWYQQAQVRTLEKLRAITGQCFPGKETIASVGYASEMPMLGNDQGRHIEAMARLGLSCQSPGDVGYLATRRVSTACRFYGVPYYTEPPGDVPPERQMNRIFMDIGNGTQNWFDYPTNLDRARPAFRQYKHLLTGEAPLASVAVWHPTLDHWLHPGDAWSAPLIDCADALRETFDYEVMDDRLITAGALEKLQTRQLILAGAHWLDEAAWAAAQRWVEGGGVLIILHGAQPMTNLTGDGSRWARQAPAKAPALSADEAFTTATLDRLWREGGVKLGRGMVLTLDTAGLARERRAELCALLCAEAGTRVGEPAWNAKHLDGRIDGILCTRFAGRILYYNQTAEAKQVTLEYRAADFAPGQPRPAALRQTLELAPRAIAEVALTAPAGEAK